ncbi:MAG TPA: hypothetical protein VNW06_08240 [Cytophagaceae bacterium]|nr:hypothetical protein [Cytophagaceae bacterium]
MYKIVSKNIDLLNMGDNMVDFGMAIDFYDCLSEDETELLSLPKADKLYFAKIIDIEKGFVKIKWDVSPPVTVSINRISLFVGWDKVAIVPEKDILFLRLKRT